ncbi:hypothetical protein Cpir12675_005926, partial [Ceratocystis pirilliformis]
MPTLTTPAAKTALEAPASKRATTNIDSGKKAPTIADIARKPAQTPTATAGAVAKNPHESTKQGGTEVERAQNTDAYVIGPVERHLNGGNRTVEQSQ